MSVEKYFRIYLKEFFRTYICLVGIGFLILSVPAYGESCSSSESNSTKQAIEKLLNMVNLEISDGLSGEDLSFCNETLKVFQEQSGTEHVKPLVRTEEYESPELRVYKQICPKLEFNKRVTYPANIGEDVWRLPEREKERFGNVYRGTKNFKLFKGDFTTATAKGKLIAFYHERFHLERSHGESAIPGAGEAYEDGGEFKIFNIETCAELFSVPVYSYRDQTGLKGYNGMFKLGDEYYIYDLYPLGRTNKYYLTVWAYNEKREDFRPKCWYSGLLKVQD